MDPKWYVAKNELGFLNSLKMKLAVIYGVTQMTLGIICKGLNCIHRGSALDFIFEFIPQLVFLLCLFGFMDLLIILKWLTNWEGRTNEAPSIISQMINIALKGGEVQGSALVVDTPTQVWISQLLLAICLVCVPLMLFVKPIYLARKYAKADELTAQHSK